MAIRFTRHALAVMEERAIRREWIEAVLARPEWTEPDRSQPGVTLAFGRIAEFGDRILRVVYDEDATGRRIITTFFDRTRRRTGASP